MCFISKSCTHTHKHTQTIVLSVVLRLCNHRVFLPSMFQILPWCIVRRVICGESVVTHHAFWACFPPLVCVCVCVTHVVASFKCFSSTSCHCSVAPPTHICASYAGNTDGLMTEGRSNLRNTHTHTHSVVAGRGVLRQAFRCDTCAETLTVFVHTARRQLVSLQDVDDKIKSN